MKKLMAFTITVLSMAVAMAQAAPTAASVSINSREEMAAFLRSGRYTPVQDKAAFLKSVPGLPGLLSEISRADGQIAMNLFKTLLKNDYFKSKVPLKLLPSQQTAIVGTKADVQLAVTIAPYTVLAPEYAVLGDQQAYLLVHEALHSLVSDYKNPFHDHQVKNITNYLRQNRGAYERNAFLSFFLKNYVRYETLDSNGSYLFDLSVSAKPRCSVLQEEIPSENLAVAEKYFGLSCDFTEALFLF